MCVIACECKKHQFYLYQKKNVLAKLITVSKRSAGTLLAKIRLWPMRATPRTGTVCGDGQCFGSGFRGLLDPDSESGPKA